jgi:type II secretory pathway component PulL
MISEVRKLHKKTSTREKFLLLLFVAGIALVWLSYSFSRYNQGYKIHAGNKSQIKTYDSILSQKEYIEAQLLQKSSQLDASKTLSSNELTGRIIEIIAPMELKYSINPPQTEEGSLFTFHNIRLSVNKAELEAVLRLSDKLKTLVPYVTLDRVIVSADRSNPSILDVQFFISSVEMTASSS